MDAEQLLKELFPGVQYDPQRYGYFIDMRQVHAEGPFRSELTNRAQMRAEAEEIRGRRIMNMAEMLGRPISDALDPAVAKRLYNALCSSERRGFVRDQDTRDRRHKSVMRARWWRRNEWRVKGITGLIGAGLLLWAKKTGLLFFLHAS